MRANAATNNVATAPNPPFESAVDAQSQPGAADGSAPPDPFVAAIALVAPPLVSPPLAPPIPLETLEL